MTRTSDSTSTLPARAPKANQALRRIAWGWVTLSAVAIAAFAATPYLTSSLRTMAGEDAGLASHYATQSPAVQLALYVHIVFAGVALVLGPLQFWAGLRERFRLAHRWIGRIYLVSVGISGVASLAMAPFNSAGFVGFFGFASLGVLWLYTAWKAYHAVRARDVRGHQAWMIRNFALTYAAVMLRLWTGVLLAVQVPFVSPDTAFNELFANAYAAVPFLCWLPNLIVAEYVIRRRGLPALRIVDPVSPTHSAAFAVAGQCN